MLRRPMHVCARTWKAGVSSCVAVCVCVAVCGVLRRWRSRRVRRVCIQLQQVCVCVCVVPPSSTLLKCTIAGWSCQMCSTPLHHHVPPQVPPHRHRHHRQTITSKPSFTRIPCTVATHGALALCCAVLLPTHPNTYTHTHVHTSTTSFIRMSRCHARCPCRWLPVHHLHLLPGTIYIYMYTDSILYRYVHILILSAPPSPAPWSTWCHILYSDVCVECFQCTIHVFCPGCCLPVRCCPAPFRHIKTRVSITVHTK